MQNGRITSSRSTSPSTQQRAPIPSSTPTQTESVHSPNVLLPTAQPPPTSSSPQGVQPAASTPPPQLDMSLPTAQPPSTFSSPQGGSRLRHHLRHCSHRDRGRCSPSRWWPRQRRSGSFSALRGGRGTTVPDGSAPTGGRTGGAREPARLRWCGWRCGWPDGAHLFARGRDLAAAS
jgi:hypothetical protein